MKKFRKIIFVIVAVAIGMSYTANAQVAINTDGTDPDASAMLDVKSTDKGFLPPRVADTNAVSNPAEGLHIYDLSSHCMRYFNGTLWSDCIGSFTPVCTVYNPTTGETWIDRNLGASQVATSSTNAAAYGDLYQWGRATEGHESRTSELTSSNATTAVPNAGNSWDGLFITESISPYDWLAPQDNTLWQGAGGNNNPCPAGFRLPTEAEWDAERQSWSSNNTAGAFGSPLKLTVGGYRNSYGSLNIVGSNGVYWSSSVSGTQARSINIGSGNAYFNSSRRAYGFSVRCIRD